MLNRASVTDKENVKVVQATYPFLLCDRMASQWDCLRLSDVFEGHRSSVCIFSLTICKRVLKVFRQKTALAFHNSKSCGYVRVYHREQQEEHGPPAHINRDPCVCEACGCVV